MDQQTLVNEVHDLKRLISRRKKAIIAAIVLILLLLWGVLATVAYDVYKETKDYNTLHAFTLADFHPILYDTDEGLVLRFSRAVSIDHLQIATSVWLQREGRPQKIAYRFLLVRNIDLKEGVEFFVQPPMIYEGKLDTVGVDITLFYNGKPFEFEPVVLKEYGDDRTARHMVTD